MSRTVKLAAVLMVILSAVACGGSSAGSIGEQAADFNATTLDGDEFRLADKRGHAVALYFMATW